MKVGEKRLSSSIVVSLSKAGPFTAMPPEINLAQAGSLCYD
jgi:hypothetical protein